VRTKKRRSFVGGDLARVGPGAGNVEPGAKKEPLTDNGKKGWRKIPGRAPFQDIAGPTGREVKKLEDFQEGEKHL